MNAQTVVPAAKEYIHFGNQVVAIETTLSVTVAEQGSAFYPIAPCRALDTRISGGPIAAGAYRPFNLQGTCGIPSSATAYALNLGVRAASPYIGWLTVWPDGQPQPTSSNLNWSSESALSGSAIIGGTNGVIDVSPSVTTDVIGDVYGYFAPPGLSGALAFHPITPCRVADTRSGSPLAAGIARSFVVAGACGVPSNAVAIASNLTVVPSAPQSSVASLTVWPAGQGQPATSALDWTTETVLANGGVFQVGSGASISVNPGAATHLIIDINGYFSPVDPSGLMYYPVTPCRLVDTRPNSLAGNVTQNYTVRGTCRIPMTAQAFTLNFAALPSQVSSSAWLTLWPSGQAIPGVSTLNWTTEIIRSNGAVIGSGSNGAISVNPTSAISLVVDVMGFFQ